jgi:hypothetical protein
LTSPRGGGSVQNGPSELTKQIQGFNVTHIRQNGSFNLYQHLRKYQEVVEQLDGQEAPPILDIFKNMQDGFDNVAEDSIIKMNRANVG